MVAEKEPKVFFYLCGQQVEDSFLKKGKTQREILTPGCMYLSLWRR